MKDKEILAILREAVPMTEVQRRMATLLYWDLYYGPLTYCETCGVDHLDDCTCGDLKYPGFVMALDILAEVEIPGDLWIDTFAGCVETREPEGFYDGDEYIEPNYEDYWHLDAKEIKRRIFGKEVADHL